MKRVDDAKREANIGIELLQGAYPRILKRMEALMAYFEDNKEGLRRLLPGLEASLGEPLAATAMEIAGYNFYLGEEDTGFEWLNQSYSRKESELSSISHNEFFDSVRDEPRFQNILKRLGIAQTYNVLAYI